MPDGEVLNMAKEIAATIAANGPLAVQAVLRTPRETDCLPEHEALEIYADIGVDVFKSDDAKEGPRAFIEKQTPQYQGR